MIWPPLPHLSRFSETDKRAMIRKVSQSDESCMLITFKSQAKGRSDFTGEGAPKAVLDLLNGEGASGKWQHLADFGVTMAGGAERKAGMVFFNTRFEEDHGFSVSWLRKMKYMCD